MPSLGSEPEKDKPAVLYANRAIPGRGARQTEETQSTVIGYCFSLVRE